MLPLSIRISVCIHTAESKQRRTFSIDDHLLESFRLGLTRGRFHFRNLLDAFDVSTVRSSSEDRSDETISRGVSVGHERSGGVVDEGDAFDRDGFLVESGLEQLYDVYIGMEISG